MPARPCRRRIPLVELLRDLDQGPGEARREDRPRPRGGARAGRALAEPAGQAGAQGRGGAGALLPAAGRRAPGGVAGAVRGRGPGRHAQHAPDGPHAAAALRPRQAGRDRAGARGPCLPRHQCSHGRASTRNGSTPCASPGPSCGARRRIRRSTCPSTPGRATLSRHEASPAAAAAGRADPRATGTARRSSASRGRRRPSR